MSKKKPRISEDPVIEAVRRFVKEHLMSLQHSTEIPFARNMNEQNFFYMYNNVIVHPLLHEIGQLPVTFEGGDLTLEEGRLNRLDTGADENQDAYEAMHSTYDGFYSKILKGENFTRPEIIVIKNHLKKLCTPADGKLGFYAATAQVMDVKIECLKEAQRVIMEKTSMDHAVKILKNMFPHDENFMGQSLVPVTPQAMDEYLSKKIKIYESLSTYFKSVQTKYDAIVGTALAREHER